MSYEIAFWALYAVCAIAVALGGVGYLIDNRGQRWPTTLLDVGAVIGCVVTAPFSIVVVGAVVLLAAIQDR